MAEVLLQLNRGLKMTILKKMTFGAVSLALLAAPVAPVMAADLGSAQSRTAAENDDILMKASSNDYRRRYRHRYHDRVDAGDVIAGIGILAGIAIIADAASKSKKRDREVRRYPQEYPQPYPQDNRQDSRQSYPERDDRPADYGNNASNSDLGEAVTACSREAESRSGRNVRVEEISSVVRDGDAWRVEGRVSGNNAAGFSCGVTAGRVDYFRYNI
jgi:hypothetical protein